MNHKFCKRCPCKPIAFFIKSIEKRKARLEGIDDFGRKICSLETENEGQISMIEDSIIKSINTPSFHCSFSFDEIIKSIRFYEPDSSCCPFFYENEMAKWNKKK